jgi:two-component system alkaline phosphatase synthesis response regulator PhoP
VNTDSAAGETILVADDSKTILAMVSSRLNRAGYDVITATRGDEALRLALERQPRLVVLDVEMPGLDGVEVARRLRAGRESPGLRIILLTAHDEPDEIARGLEAGADDYITKPFSPQELQTRIDRLLGMR